VWVDHEQHYPITHPGADADDAAERRYTKFERRSLVVAYFVGDLGDALHNSRRYENGYLRSSIYVRNGWTEKRVADPYFDLCVGLGLGHDPGLSIEGDSDPVEQGMRFAHGSDNGHLGELLFREGIG
jgi:hypothetical protein